MRNRLYDVLLGLIAALCLAVIVSPPQVRSAVIQAVIPQVVPTANKRGTSSIFALATSTTAASPGTTACDDGHGNITTSGCLAAATPYFWCNPSCNSTVLSIFAGASATQLCNVMTQGKEYSYSSAATFSFGAGPTGSGSFAVYSAATSGIITLQYSNAVSTITAAGAAGGSAVAAPVASPTIPGDCGTNPIATGMITNGAFVAASILDLRAFSSACGPFAGTGIATVLNGVVAIDSTVPQKAASNIWTGQNDFSAASSVLPVPVVTSLPATCSLYQVVWLTTATAGQNLYGCTASNVWTQLG